MIKKNLILLNTLAVKLLPPIGNKPPVNTLPPSLCFLRADLQDASSPAEFLKEPLDKWLAEHVPIAQVVRLPERRGLITARQEGAKKATADTIVVLDSHCEVMINWLPPLLGESFGPGVLLPFDLWVLPFLGLPFITSFACSDSSFLRPLC